MVNVESSKLTQVVSGVPQGSVLGLFLFLRYTLMISIILLFAGYRLWYFGVIQPNPIRIAYKSLLNVSSFRTWVSVLLIAVLVIEYSLWFIAMQANWFQNTPCRQVIFIYRICSTYASRVLMFHEFSLKKKYQICNECDKALILKPHKMFWQLLLEKEFIKQVIKAIKHSVSVSTAFCSRNITRI